MLCHSCGRFVSPLAERCMACGHVLGTSERYGHSGGILVTDGGKEPTDESGTDPLNSTGDTETESPDDTEEEHYLAPEEIVRDDLTEESVSDDSTTATTESTETPPETGESEQSTSQPARYQSQGSQPGSYQPQTSQSLSSQTETESNTGGELVEQITQFPLKLGAALGAVAFLFPYLLLTIATYWAYDQSPLDDPEMGAFDVGAEVFMTIVGFGSGQRVVDMFIAISGVGVTSPGEVDPTNYPTVENQLGPLLELLEIAPEVPLLILYLVAPYALFVSGRYLARHYAPSASPVDRMLAGMTVVLGTLPVLFLVGLVFGVFAFAERLIFIGFVIPAVVGAVSGLSIWLFNDHSAIVSTLVGWTAIALSIAVAAVLLPLGGLELADDARLTLSFLDRLVIGLGAYLNILEFNMGAHNQGRLYFLLVALITITAGFLRTWRIREPVENRMDGALVGSSIWLGFAATIALFLWLFPMSTILVDIFITGDGGTLVAGISASAVDGGGSVAVPTIESVVSVDSYLHSIVVAGFVFPAIFGGIGGYLAVWQDER